MYYWTRIRKSTRSGGSGKSIIKLESDDIRDLWYRAYSFARLCKKTYKGEWTFRIYDDERPKRYYSRIWL